MIENRPSRYLICYGCNCRQLLDLTMKEEMPTWIHHHHVVLILSMELMNKLACFVQREAFWVQCKDLEPIHVVLSLTVSANRYVSTTKLTHNIGPHSLKGYLRLGIVLDNFSHIFNISIPKSALVKPQTPVGHHSRFPGNFTELSRHIDWIWT